MERIINVMAGVSAIFILFILLSICAEVIMRYFFKSPLLWSIEISEYLLLCLTFMGAPWVLRHNGHVRLETIVDMLGAGSKKVLYYVTNLLGLFTVMVIMYFSGIVTYEQLLLKTPVIKSLEIPKWIILAPIPVGCFFLSLEFIRKLCNGYRKG
ncbi:MAG: TRAP transporter small permease [Candidatus Contubernalis sp.]|nr:TRAP transporter small permease [Candidatus Contubernalis sp.]